MAGNSICYVIGYYLQQHKFDWPHAKIPADVLAGIFLLDQISPLSAKDMTMMSATIKWSSTLISTSDNACFSASVNILSDWLGSATPDGWLCAKITAAALSATRPLGAVVGDYLDKPLSAGGLALSRYTASAVLLVFIVACILIFEHRPAKQGH